MADQTTRTETIAVNDGSFEGHLALPPSNSGPGILLLQEIFGVNDFLTEKAADLAALGYVVLAPDVFWRLEPNIALPHDEESLGKAFGIAGVIGQHFLGPVARRQLQQEHVRQRAIGARRHPGE